MHLSSASRAPGALIKTALPPPDADFDAGCPVSRLTQNKTHMSDTEKSGAPTPAPADLTAPVAPAPAASVSATPAFGSFGANRGSGLLRGKRPAVASASASAPAAPSGYKPSALEVITPASEYKNPFTGETSVSAPRANEPVAPAAPAPAPVAAAPAPVARTEPVRVSTPPVAVPAAPADVPPSSIAPTVPPMTPAPKAELNILPPETAKRSALSWEAPSSTSAEAPQPSARREDRPTFQPRDRRDGREGRDTRDGRDSREGRSFEPREGRGEGRDPRDGRDSRDSRDSRDGRGNREPRSLEPREPRRDERKFEPRSNQPYREPKPAAEPEKKSGGFFGWFKGLFSRKKKVEPAPTDGGTSPEGDSRRDGGDRGGRGRGGYRGDNRGPRDPNGQQQHEGGGGYRGEPRGDDEYGGQRRRRRRGGRGRFRDGGGGGGGRDDRGPRPEGQQGGGAI